MCMYIRERKKKKKKKIRTVIVVIQNLWQSWHVSSNAMVGEVLLMHFM